MTPTLLGLWSALLWAAPSGDPEALALFQAAEAKLLAAKSLRVEGRMASTGSFESTLEVSLKTQVDRKAHFSIKGDLLGRPAQVEMRSDGKTLRWAGRAMPTPAALHHGLVISFLRVGLLYETITLATGTQPEGSEGQMEGWMEVDALALGPLETVDGVTTRRIDFDLVIGKVKSGRVELWIDVATGLPSRRSAVVDFQGTMAVSERYRLVELDGPVPKKPGKKRPIRE